MTYVDRNPCAGLGQAHTCVVVKPANWDLNPLPSNNESLTWLYSNNESLTWLYYV